MTAAEVGLVSGAACRGRWDLFDSTQYVDHMEARAICARCSFTVQCRAILAETMQTGTLNSGGGPVGTWAGQLYGRQTGRTPNPRECGTPRGYYQHRHYGEPACEPCKAAHASERRGVRAS